jgi:hypothetical protein
MNVEIGAEAALFPEQEYISGIFLAVLLAGTRLPILDVERGMVELEQI